MMIRIVSPSLGWGWWGQRCYLLVKGPGQLLTLQGQLVAQPHHEGRTRGHPHLNGPHLGDPSMGKDRPCRAGRGSAGTGVPPGHLPTPSVSPGGSAVTRWLRFRAKPRSGMVRRETRTCRPLSAGKQSNCTCHCGEQGVTGGTLYLAVPRLHRPPQTHRRAAQHPASLPNLQPASAVGAQLHEGELQSPDTAELCEKQPWGADMGGGTGCVSPAAGMPGPATPART